MNLKNFSLVKKLTLSVVPMVVAASFVSVSIYRKASVPDNEGERAMQMVALVNVAELEMVKMSEALRGYLLDGTNRSEYDKKKAADEAYGQAAAALGELLQDEKEIQILNQQMADFDASDLDRIENGVAELIQKQSPEAIHYYTNKYMPARASQTKNFLKLKELVTQKAGSLVAKIQHQRIVDAIQSILMLIASVIFGVTCVLLVTFSNLKRAKQLFDRVYEISDLVNESSTELLGTSVALSESVSDQASAIQETAAALEEVSAMIKKNSDNASQSKNFTSQTKRVTEEGRSSTHQMQNAMTEIAQSNDAIMNQVETGNRDIAQIVKLIGEISEKTKVINDIVFQTKLLSFNASVEAARAGEHGKGFAVVAEEVGKLASMSGNAAKEISDKLTESATKVEQIIQVTKREVEGMIGQGKQKVSQGVLIATTCGKVLEQIAQDVYQVDQMVSEIDMASAEQSKGVSEINKAVAQLDNATQKNNDSARQSSSQADSLSANSNSLRTLVDELYSLFNGNEPGHAHSDQSKALVPELKSDSEKKAA